MGVVSHAGDETETFPRHESPYGCSHTPPTHNIASITLAPWCGNTLLFINDRRKCRSRLINALARLLRFESFFESRGIKSCRDGKGNWMFENFSISFKYNNRYIAIFFSSIDIG